MKSKRQRLERERAKFNSIFFFTSQCCYNRVNDEENKILLIIALHDVYASALTYEQQISKSEGQLNPIQAHRFVILNSEI